MKFNGAIVKTPAREIGVAVVDKSFVDKEPIERAKYIKFQSFFYLVMQTT